MSKLAKNNAGQAMVSLVIFMLIATIVTSTAVAVVITNSVSASKLQQGTLAYAVAESGIEDTLLQLLRNPQYTGTPVNQPLLVGNGNAAITVQISGVSPNINYVITSIGTYKTFQRKIEVDAGYNNSNQLIINRWFETF